MPVYEFESKCGKAFEELYYPSESVPDAIVRRNVTYLRRQVPSSVSTHMRYMDRAVNDSERVEARMMFNTPNGNNPINPETRTNYSDQELVDNGTVRTAAQGAVPG